jgi:GNAT superfamily N-acetyltransferase
LNELRFRSDPPFPDCPPAHLKYGFVNSPPAARDVGQLGIRILESREDIDFAVGLTVEEGWNYTPKEIGLMLELDPEGSFIYEEGKDRLGFVTTVTYSRTGVIGHLIVSGKARRRKIGDSLVRSAIEYMEGKGVDSMMLYATEEGSNLYQRHGFTARDEVLCVHSRLKKAHMGEKSAACAPITSKDLDEIISIDSELFGDNRSRVMKVLHRHSLKCAFKIDRGNGIEGYIFARPDHVGHDLGPWACLNTKPGDAEDLFSTALSTIGEGTLYSGTFAKNAEAGRIIKKLPIDRTWIVPMMIRGKSRYGLGTDKAFAVAAFELG